MQIEQNSVWKIQGLEGIVTGIYRVLFLSHTANIVIIYPLIEKKVIKRPLLVPLDQFENSMKLSEVTTCSFDVPNYQLFNDKSLPKAHLEKRSFNFSLIRELVENPNSLYEISINSRVSLIKDQAVLKGTNRKKISLLLCQYWFYGQSLNALLPAYNNSGASGGTRQSSGKSLGAPKRARTLAIIKDRKFILEDKDKGNIKEALKLNYLKPNGISLKSSYKGMLRDYYSSEIQSANTFKRVPYVPSYRQFGYWKDKLFEAHEITKLMHTQRDYLQNYRSILGSATEFASIPGSCFEIDATVADIHIVSTLGKRNNLLGRPTIYSVVDRASRMIVGLHVSLYHASWKAAQLALANCFLPKAEYCQRYGIDIEESDWPCAHLPQSLTCDNGEMIGLKSQQIMSPLLELHIAPAYRPEMKGIVV